MHRLSSMFSSASRALGRVAASIGSSRSEKACAWGNRVAVAAAAAAVGATTSLTLTARRRETADDAYLRALSSLPVSALPSPVSAPPPPPNPPIHTSTPPAQHSRASRAGDVARDNLSRMGVQVDPDFNPLYLLRNLNPSPDLNCATLGDETAVVAVLPNARDADLNAPYLHALRHASSRDGDGFTFRVVTCEESSSWLQSKLCELDPPFITLLPRYDSNRNRFDLRTSTVDRATPTVTYARASVTDLNCLPAALLDLISRFKSASLAPTLTSTEADSNPLSISTATLLQLLSSSSRTPLLLVQVMHDCPMCMCLSLRVAMAAQVLQVVAPTVQVATLDVDANERPRDVLHGSSFPAITFLPSDRLEGRSMDLNHPSGNGRSVMPSVGRLVEWAAQAPLDSNTAALCEQLESEASRHDGAVFELLFFISLLHKYASYYSDADGHYAALQRAVDAARVAIVEQVNVGGYEAALQALEQVEEVVARGDMLVRVRQRMREEVEAREETEALALAQALSATGSSSAGQ